MKLPQQLVHIAGRILRLPAARALLVCGLLWLLFFSYGRLFLWRDPHSAYFSSDGVYDLDYSAARQREARDFIAKVTDDHNAGKARLKAGDTPSLCAAFVTVRRDGDQARFYMADALGSMLAGLDVRERAALKVNLLFGNMDPKTHPDWEAPWVRALADEAAGYKGVREMEMKGLRVAEKERDLQLKGVFDYNYVAEQCLEETSAPFIGVFEDDVMFSADWMARTMRGLQWLVRDYKPAEGEQDWLYLRLFYTETHLGWSNEGDWWYNHLPLTLAMAAAGSAVLLVALRLCGCGEKLRLDWLTIAVVSLVVAPGFTMLAFMAGKHNLPIPGYSLHHSVPYAPLTSAEAAGVVPMDKRGCCTQALVFNRRALPALIKWLREKQRGQTDSMIEEYCDETGMKRFALREQVVQHVGLVSSRGMAAKDTRSVWAFWFEANKPQEVEARHREVVEEIDWAMLDRLATGA